MQGYPYTPSPSYMTLRRLHIDDLKFAVEVRHKIGRDVMLVDISKSSVYDADFP